MADHFIGLNRGQQGVKDSDFTYGTATGATDVEVRIADAKGLTRQDVIIILQRINDFLVSANPKIAATRFPVGF